MQEQVDPSVCPTCGEPNACGLRQGKSDCWCLSANIPEAAIARIPSQAKDLACICPRCAAVQAAKLG